LLLVSASSTSTRADCVVLIRSTFQIPESSSEKRSLAEIKKLRREYHIYAHKKHKKNGSLKMATLDPYKVQKLTNKQTNNTCLQRNPTEN